MRYYAEWLDGEYILLNHAMRGYDHSTVMKGAIKFHALFGSTIVISDVQMIDFKSPITEFFQDEDFRAFLDQTVEEREQDFLSLVAEPVQGIREQPLAIAMRGIKRLIDMKNKPLDSFEWAAAKMGESILKAGHFDAEKHLSPGERQRDQIGRAIGRYSTDSKNLTGLLHAIQYFSRSPLKTTTQPSRGSSEGYDKLLRRFADKLSQDAQKVKGSLSERDVTSIQNRVGMILQIQERHLPLDQHGKRAAIRRVLGNGPLGHETWNQESLRQYLDVVHAWNCAVKLNLTPEAGTLYESHDDIPLSSFEAEVSDRAGWVRRRPMPSANLSDRICHFFSCDPANLNWKQIGEIARLTWPSAKQLQSALKRGSKRDREEALTEHAEQIAECLVDSRPREVPEFVWWIAKGAAEKFDIPSETVEFLQEIPRQGPYALAAVQQKIIVNTIRRAGSRIL